MPAFDADGLDCLKGPRYRETFMAAAAWNRAQFPLAVIPALVLAGWITSRVGDNALTDAAVPATVAVFLAVGSAMIAAYARRGESLSILPLVTAFYLLAFALGALYYRYPGHAVGTSALRGFQHSYTNSGLAKAIALALVAYLALAVGFLGARFMRGCRRLPAPESLEGERLGWVAFWLIALGWTARVLLVRHGLYFRYSGATRGQFATLIYTLGYLPLMGFAIVAIQRTREGLYRRWYWILLASEVAWALPSGERARIVGLGLLLLVNRYYSSTAFPWRRFAIWAAVVVFIVLPFGAFYRGPGGASDYQQHPVSQIFVAAKKTADLFALPRVAFDETFSRFSDIASLASITTQGRPRYPDDGHETMTIWWQALIPRFILPGKTNPGNLGNSFGLNYGIIGTGSSSSISMTYVGDLYGSFGFWPMILGMLVVGALMRGLDEYFFDRRTNPLTLAVYMTMLGPFLLRLESSIAVGFIQSLKDILVYAVAAIAVLAFVRGPKWIQRSVHVANR